MNITKMLVIAGAAGAASISAADVTPVVSGVTMTQPSGTRLTTITYSLSAPAVVTLDVQTNYTEGGATKWASIGGEAVCNAQGAVWRKVTTADLKNGSYEITWRPDLSWPDHVIGDGGARAVVTAWALDNTPDYMVVDISATAAPDTQKYYPAAEYLPGGILSNQNYRTTKLVMRKIMAKDVEWTMGSTGTETQRESARESPHQVSLTNNYYIGVFEVTQSQWALFSTRTANYTVEGSMRPMENVCYNELRQNSSYGHNGDYNWPHAPNPDSYIGKLRLKTGVDFDLPSEAQWEFACRAGNGVGYWGDGSAIKNGSPDANLDKIGRYSGNNPGGSTSDKSFAPNQGGTAIVGSYMPNNWGLYDMNGNVWEWCLDWFADNINSLNGAVNVTENWSNSNGLRVKRGGAYAGGSTYSRPAWRQDAVQNNYGRDLNSGFRLVCTAGLK